MMSDLAASAAGDELSQSASARHPEDNQRSLMPSRRSEQRVGRAADCYLGLIADSGSAHRPRPVLRQELPDLVTDGIGVHLNRGEFPLPGR